MRLILATKYGGRVAHICIQGGIWSEPLCRSEGFYAREENARRNCPACIAVIRKLLRQRPKR